VIFQHMPYRSADKGNPTLLLKAMVLAYDGLVPGGGMVMTVYSRCQFAELSTDVGNLGTLRPEAEVVFQGCNPTAEFLVHPMFHPKEMAANGYIVLIRKPPLPAEM
jgi:hypothetical protein